MCPSTMNTSDTLDSRQHSTKFPSIQFLTALPLSHTMDKVEIVAIVKDVYFNRVDNVVVGISLFTLAHSI